MPLYDRTDASAVLRRAAEIEAARASAARTGLTLDELKAAGAGAGLSAAAVEQAARELVAAREAPGGARRHREVRFLPGPLTDEGWAAAVRDARATYGGEGVLEPVGATRAWARTVEGVDFARVTATPEPGGGTRLVVDADLAVSVRGSRFAIPFLLAAVFMFVTALGGALLGLPDGWAPGGLGLAALVGVAVGVALGPPHDRHVHRRTAAKAAALADRIAAVAASAEGAGSTAGAPAGPDRAAPEPAAPAPLLTLPDAAAVPDPPDAVPARHAPLHREGR